MARSWGKSRKTPENQCTNNKNNGDIVVIILKKICKYGRLSVIDRLKPPPPGNI